MQCPQCVGTGRNITEGQVSLCGGCGGSGEIKASPIVDAYLGTIERLEPDIAMIDAGTYYASAAISLKRIADALEALSKPSKTAKTFNDLNLPCPDCEGRGKNYNGHTCAKCGGIGTVPLPIDSW